MSRTWPGASPIATVAPQPRNTSAAATTTAGLRRHVRDFPRRLDHVWLEQHAFAGEIAPASRQSPRARRGSWRPAARRTSDAARRTRWLAAASTSRSHGAAANPATATPPVTSSVRRSISLVVRSVRSFHAFTSIPCASRKRAKIARKSRSIFFLCVLCLLASLQLSLDLLCKWIGIIRRERDQRELVAVRIAFDCLTVFRLEPFELVFRGALVRRQSQ